MCGKALMEDEIIFGENKWVYCPSHLRAHPTGVCSIPAKRKTLLSASTREEAAKECEARGLK